MKLIHKILRHNLYCTIFTFTDMNGKLLTQISILNYAKSPLSAENKAHRSLSYDLHQKILSISTERVD